MDPFYRWGGLGTEGFSDSLKARRHGAAVLQSGTDTALDPRSKAPLQGFVDRSHTETSFLSLIQNSTSASELGLIEPTTLPKLEKQK